MSGQKESNLQSGDCGSPSPTGGASIGFRPLIPMFAKARRESSGAIEWDLDNNPSPRQGVKWPVTLPVKGGPHNIVYHLVPSPGLDFEFNCEDPMWTEDNSDCPPARGLNSDQIQIVDCQAKKLTVTNLNKGPARLVRYQLNFVDAGGGRAPPACDPAILNGGGGKI